MRSFFLVPSKQYFAKMIALNRETPHVQTCLQSWPSVAMCGFAWQCTFAAEELPIKSDYERSESKDLMVHSDKPQRVAKHSKRGKASNTWRASPARLRRRKYPLNRNPQCCRGCFDFRNKMGIRDSVWLLFDFKQKNLKIFGCGLS